VGVTVLIASHDRSLVERYGKRCCAWKADRIA
jgi:ABC-type ATPase involved in cell division